MGKLHTIGNLTIRVYAADHLPAHFHIVAPDFEALVEIATMTILRGSVSGKAGKDALTWAAEHRAEIIAEWNRINPRFPAK